MTKSSCSDNVTFTLVSFGLLFALRGLQVTWINSLLPSSLPDPYRDLPSALLPGTTMATWAYPPLPAEQLIREADSALVRKEGPY